jgi:Peptidase family S41
MEASARDSQVQDVTVVKSPAGLALARVFPPDLKPESNAAVYSLPDRQRIVEQLRLLLREFYVHLEMKKAQYGFDALRAVDRLEAIVPEISDADFHQSVIQVITRTRDRHLQFRGRGPNGLSAAVGFYVECCYVNDKETYVVTKITSDLGSKHLSIGAIVTHWNGVPIDRQVRLAANLFDGGNEPASLARSIEFLTARPLSRFALPTESWVMLRFLLDAQVYEERFDWRGFDLGQVPLTPAIGRNVIGFGGDPELIQIQTTKRIQFAPQSFDRQGVGAEERKQKGIRHLLGRGLKSNFQFGRVSTQFGTFGYIRMYDFAADDVNDIARDMVTILPLLPREGLIIDIRGNNGGYIAAGERVLQLLTPRDIIPTRFQFRATAGIRKMLPATPYFDKWKQSILDAVRTGEPFSQGYPIEGTDEDANRIGQRYFGPVVLITDALAFSTADIFAAGFIDHGIGNVICIDKNMAAAGGNNWQFNVLELFNPDFQMDLVFRADLDKAVVSTALKDEFSQHAVPLTTNGLVSPPRDELDGIVWDIRDGSLVHRVRYVKWLNAVLNVYPDSSRSGLQDLPNGIGLGFTVRRCIRSGTNEGRLLEDLGIQPHVTYRPTLKDVLGDNEDLLTKASQQLSGLPYYDLSATTEGGGELSEVVCVVRNMSRLEAFCNGTHVRSAEVPPEGTIRFAVPREKPPSS